MSIKVELSEYEWALVKDHRRDQALKEVSRRKVATALCVAYQFEEWMQENRFLPTYSIFCQWMEKTGRYESDRPNLYELVLKIRSAAWGENRP